MSSEAVMGANAYEDAGKQKNRNANYRDVVIGT